VTQAVCEDHAGRDRVHPHRGRKFRGALFGEVNQSGFAGVVDSQVRLGGEPA
jgi:hypothetical protein